MYCGALAYADDIVLLCPSVNGMNKLYVKVLLIIIVYSF